MAKSKTTSEDQTAQDWVDPAGSDADNVDVPMVLPTANAEIAAQVMEGKLFDADLPGKLYKRKADGFVARIPGYTWEEYTDEARDQWDLITLGIAADAVVDEASE